MAFGYDYIGYVGYPANGNPGNIKYVPGKSEKWKGYTGNDGTFVIFDSPENGIRAIAINLVNGYFKAGINTPAAIAAKWDNGDTPENIATYTNTLAYATGIDANTAIPLTHDNIINLVKGIIMQENSLTDDNLVSLGVMDAETDRPELFPAGYMNNNLVQKVDKQLDIAKQTVEDEYNKIADNSVPQKAGLTWWEGALLAGFATGTVKLIINHKRHDRKRKN